MTHEINIDGITIIANTTGFNDDYSKYKGYAIDDLRKLFDEIADPKDWKAPISIWVKGEGVKAAVATIEFFTATNPSVQLDTDKMLYLVESIGYRMGPAGP